MSYLRAIVVVLTVGLGVRAYASNASLDVDQTSVEQDQTVTAVFTYKGKLNTEPDFSPLDQDFTVVSQGLSKSVEIINGNYREQQAWTTILLPKRVGTVDIPAIKFGNDESNAVTLNVSPAKPSSGKDLGDLFLEAELTPDEGGYVQQQHLFIVRIYFRGWLIDGKLSEPELAGQDVVVQSLGEPRRYSVTRNGERYQVYERRHALFPQASGELTVGETTFSGRLRLPVGGNRLKSVSTQPITTPVKPVPANFSGSVWLPAESLTLSEVWPSDNLTFEQGVPISRTLNLAALGLTSAQLPTLELQGNDSVRVYPDQPQAGDQVGEKGVTGRRAVSVALVPQRSGDIELPPVEVVWWDTVNDRERVARLEPKTLSVLAGAGAATAAARTATPTQVVRTTPWRKNPWFFATLLCAAGWLFTWFYRPRHAVSGEPDTWAQAGEGGSVQQRLKVACHRNDARACAHLFGEFSRGMSVKQGAQWLEQPEYVDLKTHWQQLNRALYGPLEQRQSWMGGRDLWQAVEQATKQAQAPVRSSAGQLAELAPTA